MVDVVPITPEHIASFNQTLDSVARERRYLSFLEGPSVEASRAFVLDNIERGHPQFVAVDGPDQVIGWCDITPKTRPIYAHSGVLGMGLLPAFRGRGLGTQLIKCAIAAASQKKLHRVELTVREGNINAIRLYKKMGFSVEGIHRDAVHVDGMYENVIFMAILI
jgi:RimJ/RimL family protein N-acetyltransferase